MVLLVVLVLVMVLVASVVLVCRRGGWGPEDTGTSRLWCGCVLGGRERGREGGACAGGSSVL